MKHAVVTGAADGIGRAIARRLAQAGYAVSGIDRDAERARQTQVEFARAGFQINFLLTDLADRRQLEQLLDGLDRRPAIDLLVHNAGISAVGRFGQLPLAAQRKVVEVNLLAPLLITARLLERQQLCQGGGLIFIASLSHFVSYPGAAVYAATKDGLASYARSLSISLARREIHVLTVYPGPTRTAHAQRYSPDNSRAERRMPPETLAEQIFQAMQQRQQVLVPGPGNKLFAMIGRWLPGLAEVGMKRMLLDKLP